jgi:hypothetical protein
MSAAEKDDARGEPGTLTTANTVDITSKTPIPKGDVRPPIGEVYEPGNIPGELKAMARWSPWRARWNEKRGKWDKIPGKRRSTAEPWTWLPFEEADRQLLADSSFAGVGFVVTGLTGYTFIDVDECIDETGGLSERALDIIAMVGSYTEVSPSGRGLRIVARGTSPADWTNNDLGVEVYAGHTARFLTITGDAYSGDFAIRDITGDTLAELRSRYGKSSATKPIIPADLPERPELIPEIQLPDISSLGIKDRTRAFLVDGVEGEDGSLAVHIAGIELYRLGLDNQMVLSILASSYAMDVALRHRNDNHDRALDYLWKEHCLKAKPKALTPKQIMDDFEDLWPISGPSNPGTSQGESPLGSPGGTAELEWPTPKPLPGLMPPVEPFDPALLPVALRAWIMDISYRMQSPPDFSAVAVVAAASGLIGARAVVCPKENDDWRVVPNLWALAVGRPGVMKSPAIDEAIRPLSRLEATERERYQAAMNEHEIDVTVAGLAAKESEKLAKKQSLKDPAAAKKLLRGGMALDEPKQRRYIVNDTTVEALGMTLEANPWGTLIYRDELYGLLTSLDKEGQEGSRAFYLTGYDGNKSYQSDRVTRGQTFNHRVCLAMLGGIQPGRIRQYVQGAVEGGTGDDGLLQRFGLTVWPDVDAEFLYVDQRPDSAAKEAGWEVFQRLSGLQPVNPEEPQVWRFSPAAQLLFVEWYTSIRLELKHGGLHPALESHLTKYAKLIPALALIFAHVDTPTSENVIHEAEFRRALAWCRYLRSHADRLYFVAANPEVGAATTLLTKIKAGKLVDADGVLLEVITPRQVVQKAWTGLTSTELVAAAARLLAAYGWVKLETKKPGPEGGRISVGYRINPAAFVGGVS